MEEPAVPLLEQDSTVPIISACRIRNAWSSILHAPLSRPLCSSAQQKPSSERLERSRSERPYSLCQFVKIANLKHINEKEREDTVLYLAYGSNLAYETFQGKRAIRPLSQINVVVPELQMTFDLPGIPYTEPCFANTRLRVPKGTDLEQVVGATERELPWTKGLVGVVYEVTAADYAHIIATEGGGLSYQDVLVDCYPLDSNAPLVPEVPTNTPFKAHTLFAPTGVERTGRRPHLLDPHKLPAQPSARYLHLITSGGREHGLPAEYLAYLDSLHYYRVTTFKQQVGRGLFVAIWKPIMALIFGLMRVFQDKDTGKNPMWLNMLLTFVFSSLWKSYNNIFKPIFGDGERTIGDEMDSSLEEVWNSVFNVP